MSTTLTKQEQSALQKHLEAIDKAKGSYHQSVLEIGQHLAAIKDILPAGDFIPWVGENCRFSKSTAYSYIQAYKVFGSFQRLEWIEPDCLYLLARCEPAAKEAKAIASKGQHITLVRAKAILQKFKEVAKPKPKPEPVAPAPKPADDDIIEGEIIEPAAPAAPAVVREPGDDTELLKAEQAKRRNSGKEKVTPKLRKEVEKTFSRLVKLTDECGLHDACRPHLSSLLDVLKKQHVIA